MRQAAAELNFEEAASLRDRMIGVKKCCLIWNSTARIFWLQRRPLLFGKPFMGKQPA